ncbi:MAG: DUF3857 domain-containing protein [Candidatus Korobacteraceae bacterium]|jgi:hypothetical protein
MARLRSWALSAISPWIILIIAVSCSTAARAGIGFQPISPEELKMTSEPKAPGAPAVILFRQVDRDDNGRTSHEDDYFRVKILTEEGRKYADIEIPFFKESSSVDKIRARTIRPDGSVINFDGQVFEKTIVKAKGVKYLAKTFTLPDVQAGSIVEYFYTINLGEEWIYESHWIVSNELFTKRAKFSLKPYTNTYQTVNFHWSWQGVPTPPKDGPDHIIRLEMNDIAGFQTEDYMPPENELKARVNFTYSEEFQGNDPAAFWKRTGKKMNAKMEDFIDRPNAMERAVSEIVSPSDSPEQKAEKLYTRVQQLRNTFYEVHKSEQEKKRDNEKELPNVEAVWNNGYGDGWQLTWLYLGLVRAAGLEAYGVMVSDRDRYFLNPTQMDSTKLDANVVLLRLNGQDVYCDPGAAYTPFGLLPWQETGVRGLRLDKNGGSWIQTTRVESSVSRIERTANLKLLADTGELEGKVTVTYTGLEASSRRVNQRNQDETARKKFLEDELRESIPVSAEVELVNKSDWKSSSLPLVAEFSLKVPGWAIPAGRRALLTIGLFSAAEKHVFEHDERTHPIYYQYPSTKLDDITIELPDGWRAISLPPEASTDLKSIAFDSKLENDKGRLHLSRKLTTDILMLDAKYYSTLQNFYRMVRTRDEEQIVLLPGTAAASR